MLCLSDKEKYVLIENNKIVEIEKGLPPKGYDPIFGKNLTRGLVNGHIHIAMYKYAGLRKEDQDLMDFFKNFLWPLEKKLTSKEIYESALEGCKELLKNGTTLFYNMNPWWKEVAKSVIDSGIRASLSIAIKNEEDLKLNMELFKPKHERIIPYLGIANEVETPKEIIEKITDYNLPIHAHCAEYYKYKEILKEKHNVDSSIMFYDNLKVLNQNTILAHCVHVDEKDLEIIKKRKCNVVLNPISNKRLNDGLPLLKKMLEKNINLFFGTDEPPVEPNIDVRKVGEFVYKYYKIPKRIIFNILTNYSMFPDNADFVLWDSRDLFKAKPLYVIVDGKIVEGLEN
jgi:5-methylthioadenosine/S-adenosylhomocysteine deaminase